MYTRSVMSRALIMFALFVNYGPYCLGQAIKWVPIGAAPNTLGQVENVKPDNEVVGAVNALATHPVDAKVLYAGAVNGGIWRTENAMDLVPNWTMLTDEHESLSIGAIEFDPTDPEHKTLVAGTGGFSSFGANGERIGILRTVNGLKWDVLDGGGELKGLSISGVAPRGEAIVISVVRSEPSGKEGIWRSTNTGAAWSKLSGAADSGLPAGRSFDLAADPVDAARLFAHVASGIYRSVNTGATWEKVSTEPVNTALVGISNVKIAVGKANSVYVAIAGASQQLTAVFRSGDGGTTWKRMDLPATANGGIHPGQQASLHLSLAADPSNEHIVYIGGDRQELVTSPNAIGARDFSGNLLRGDARKAMGSQWVHLTHSRVLGADGGGTANNSAPHADSRAMVMAVNGVLIEADDGGVYRRTSPESNTGDWVSANGNLQTSEYHAIAWDSRSRVVVAGAQDTGTSEQVLHGNTKFRSIGTADGGVVLVDDSSTAEKSVRYSSFQNLGRFRRRVFDTDNNLLSDVAVPLTSLSGVAVAKQFYTPLALNAVKKKRLAIGGGNGVFESLNQGDTVRMVGPGIAANESGQDTIAYGASDNEEAIYVGSDSSVFIRSAAHPAVFKRSVAYNGSIVMSVVIDPNNWKTAYVIDPTQVFQTTDAGLHWTDITNNLAALKTRTLRSLALIPGAPPALIVGSDKGVFAVLLDGASGWIRLGDGLPKAAVYHLEYDPADEILLAGTLGRGGWTIDATTGPTPELIRVALNAAPPVPAIAAVDEEQGPAPVQLYEGVLVDVGEKRVVLMQPATEKTPGGIEAVQLSDGKMVWQTENAQKPLDVFKGRIVAQALSTDKNEFNLSVLNEKDGGQLTSGKVDLPAGIRGLLDETLEGRFVAKASTTGERATVTWAFEAGRVRGIRPGADLPAIDSPEVAPLSAPNRIRATTGALQLNLSTGAINSLNVQTPAALGSQQTTEELEAKLEDVAGEQFFTTDKRHIVSAAEVEGEDFDKYALTFYERETKEKIGQIRSHRSAVPAVVAGNRILTIADAFTVRKDGKLVDEPLQVHAYTFTGERAWSRPIRDTTFHGPYPP